nr:hypothetical protein [Tanacetum cinerariifolium]
MQQQMEFNQYSQQQQQNQSTGSQPPSDHQSFNLIDETKDENKEEPIPTPTSKKSNRGARLKAKAKKTKDIESQVEIKKRARWTQNEELLLAESFIQIFEDPKTGCDQQKDTFWYKILDVYNTEVKRRGFIERTRNMLTEKWTPMNASIQKFNQLVAKTFALSGENDEDWITRVEILYKTHVGTEFKHKSAWIFLKANTSGQTPNRQTQEGIVFVLPTKSLSILEMMRCLGLPDCKAKMEVIAQESEERRMLIQSQRIAEDMKVLQIDTRGMDPADAVIINAQKARIRAAYPPKN